jgi:predicted HAD superfamily Cof-like phosphohydrolase
MNLSRQTYAALDAVRQFHALNHQVAHDEPPEKPVPLVVAVLRMRLIAEEYAETCVALHEGDFTGAADGLADLIYVIYGTAVSYGVAVCDEFEYGAEGHPLAMPSPRACGTFMLSGAIMIEKVFHSLRTTQPCACDDPLCEAKTIDEEDYLSLQDSLHRAVRTCCHVANDWGLPLREIFFEVHRANLSKKLGGAGDGRKYGQGGGKAPGYTPPDVAGILDRVRLKEPAKAPTQ